MTAIELLTTTNNTFNRTILVSVSILTLCSCTIFTNSTKIGDAKVFVRGNEIVATNFPYPAVGITSIGSVSWGGFSFDDFDEFVYKQSKKSSANELYIVIQHVGKDEYGHKQTGEEITIGKIDINESKKYADFYHWKRQYSTYDMWMKDYDDYQRKYLEIDNPYDTSVRLVPRYEPKSIR